MILYYALILLAIITLYHLFFNNYEGFDIVGNTGFNSLERNNFLDLDYNVGKNIIYDVPAMGYDITRPVPQAIQYTEVKIPEIWEYPGKERHARLNDFNGVEYVDGKPPCARGEYGCRPVSCPAVFEDKVICWKCEDIIAQPQYEDPKQIYGGRHY